MVIPDPSDLFYRQCSYLRLVEVDCSRRYRSHQIWENYCVVNKYNYLFCIETSSTAEDTNSCRRHPYTCSPREPSKSLSCQTLRSPCGTKYLREFTFADWWFFCVLRELIFAIRTDWFFLLRINFGDFQKVPSTSIGNIFVFIEYVQEKFIYFQTINQYFVVYRFFFSEWKRQVVIERTRFLSIVFLCSEFLFTDTAAILNKFNLRSIIGCPAGVGGEGFYEHISFVFSSAFRDIFS